MGVMIPPAAVTTASAAIVIFVFMTFKNFKTTLFIFLPVIVGSLWTIGIIVGLIALAYAFEQLTKVRKPPAYPASAV